MANQLLFNEHRKICTTTSRSDKFSELEKWLNATLMWTHTMPWSNPMVGPPGKVNPRLHLINNNNKCDSGNKIRRQWAAGGCCPRCLNVDAGLLNHILSYVFWASAISPCSIRLPWAPARGVWTQASSSIFLCCFPHLNTLSLLIPYSPLIAPRDPSSSRKFPGCFSPGQSLPPPDF